MLPDAKTYASLYQEFSWNIPEFYNIGVNVCDDVAKSSPERLAIIDIDESSNTREMSFSQLRSETNQLANALATLGHKPGNNKKYPPRIGVLLPQSYETALSHIGILKAGCISIPLFTLFGEEALLHRLRDSAASAVITDKAGCEKIKTIADLLPRLQHIISIDGGDGEILDLQTICSHEPIHFDAVKTRADDAALLIYTSGTTGSPKGALHAHRVLLGHLPGVEVAFNFLPSDGDRFWTPADWAWIGGLLDVLMPSLHHGITVVARRFRKFDPAAAFELMKNYHIKNVFLPPTAIKMMRTYSGAKNYAIKLRSLGSGGEALGEDLIQWCENNLGCTVNEFYGQTECNMIVSGCSALEPITPGVMGRAVPGHLVDIINPETGEQLQTNEEGAIAVLSPNPVMFIEYWNNAEATRKKYINGVAGKWLLTGDRGLRTNEGKFKFIGRDDDIIGSAGYRIGPAEIEDCLLSHPAVQLAGAVAMPDDLRGAVVAVYLKLVDGVLPSTQLEQEIAEFVKKRLAAHEYPRAVRFVDEMPMTTTGKIIRGELRKLAKAEYHLESGKI